MRDALRDVALLQFGEIQAGREMLALSGDQHGANAVRQRREELLNPDNRLIVERIALLRPVKSQNGDRALALRNEGRRKPDCKTLRHYSTS